MNYAGNFRDIHLFAIGELRTDGWKSPWRLDLEKYLAEHPAKPRIKLVVKAPKPRGPRYDYSGKERQRLLRAKRKEKGLCTKCGITPMPDMRSCANCLDKKRAERIAA